MDILTFAISVELDGKAYYEQLATEVDDIGLKSIFTSLAADEQKHCDILKSIQASIQPQMLDSTVLEKAKSLFELLRADKSIAGSLKKSLKGYEYARKIEADSVKLYEEMAHKETDPEAAQLFLKIAGEEKQHFNILDNLYDYTLAPQNYLAWAEFSNLKEY